MLAALTGIGLFVYLILRTGTGTVVEHARAIGWGMVVIVALGGLSHLLRAWAWRLSFYSGVHVSLSRAFALRLISEAMGNFGIAAQVVGDALRVSLLGARIPMAERLSSVAIDRGMYILSSAVIGAVGTVSAVVLLSLKGVWRFYALVFAAALTMFLAIAIIGLLQRWRLLADAAHAVQRLSWARNWIAPRLSVIEAAEENLLDFRSAAPKAFWAVTVLYVISQILAVAEVYLLLRFMGVGISLTGAFVIEAFTKLINTVGALNPGNVGTYEGGNLLLARLLRFRAGAGLTLALCRRARALFWAGIGALCLIVLSRGKEHKDAGPLAGLPPESTADAASETSTERSDSGSSDAPVVVILVDRAETSGSLLPALARVGTLPTLLRAILSAKALKPSRTVVIAQGDAQYLCRELEATGRLPKSVEWRDERGGYHLAALVREFVQASDSIVFIRGDCTYRPALLSMVSNWDRATGALALVTEDSQAGIYAVSHAGAVELSSRDETQLRSLEELHLWMMSNASVTVTEVSGDSWHAIGAVGDLLSAEHKLDTWLVKPTDGMFARMNRRVSIPISRQLIKFPITPNMVTWFTLAVGIAAGVFFSRGGYWNTVLGAALSVWASILDGCDGEVARLKLQSTEFGCWLETICDYLYYLIIFTGMAVGLARSSGSTAYLLWGAALLCGSCLSFVVVGSLRRSLGGEHPEKFLAIWQKKAEGRSSNPLLFLGRHTEFIIRRCFFPYALLVFSLLNLTKLVFVMTAVGSNLVWVIALYSRIALVGKRHSLSSVPCGSINRQLGIEALPEHSRSR